TLLAAFAAVFAVALPPASAQSPKLKVGFMLPYSGTYAALGDAIEKGFRLYVAEQGGRIAGREIEYVKVDDESDPAKATDNVKKVVTITWKYAAGDESVGGFKEAFEKAGGQVVKELSLPFPNVEFQPLLTEIAAIKPDAVYTFFAGGGAVKFVKDYAAAGLKNKIPLYGPGFLTDGTLEAQGDAAQGLLTTLHYADALDNSKNNAFRAAYKAAYKTEPDVYAMQGYDAGQ